jgi:hypothetical protein
VSGAECHPDMLLRLKDLRQGGDRGLFAAAVIEALLRAFSRRRVDRSENGSGVFSLLLGRV